MPWCCTVRSGGAGDRFIRASRPLCVRGVRMMSKWVGSRLPLHRERPHREYVGRCRLLSPQPLRHHKQPQGPGAEKAILFPETARGREKFENRPGSREPREKDGFPSGANKGPGR